MSYPVKEKVISSQNVNKACAFTQNLFISRSISVYLKEKRYFNISFFIKQSKTIKIHEISIDFLYLLLDIYKILHLILSMTINNSTKLSYYYYYKCHQYLPRSLANILIIAKNLKDIKYVYKKYKNKGSKTCL